MIYVFLADGFEECEALAPVDILRRGGYEVKTVGIGGKTVTGAHKIPVVCDITEGETETDGLQMIILPGGMPGTVNLEKSGCVQGFIDYAAEKGLFIGAICAAPLILGHKGLLKGKRATCFPGFEKELSGAEFLDEPVVTDGKITTAFGAGAAFDFGFRLLSELDGNPKNADALRKSMKYNK